MKQDLIRLLQFPVEHNARMTRARTFEDVMLELEHLYTKDHSFTFEWNGTKTVFKSIYQWRDESSQEVKDLYAHADFLTVNTVYNDDTNNVEYDAYMLVDGKVANLAHVHAQVVREDGQFKYKHADIRSLS